MGSGDFNQYFLLKFAKDIKTKLNGSVFMKNEDIDFYSLVDLKKKMHSFHLTKFKGKLELRAWKCIFFGSDCRSEACQTVVGSLTLHLLLP